MDKASRSDDTSILFFIENHSSIYLCNGVKKIMNFKFVLSNNNQILNCITAKLHNYQAPTKHTHTVFFAQFFIEISRVCCLSGIPRSSKIFADVVLGIHNCSRIKSEKSALLEKLQFASKVKINVF